MAASSIRSYPLVTTNGLGEELVFERRVTAAGVEQLEGYNLVEPGAGPGFHTHLRQEERFTVVHGRLGYQVMGQPEQFAEAGETVAFPPGVAHRFRNAGETELRCDARFRPAGNVDYFLAALFDAQKRGRGGRPDLFDAAFLLWRYRTEYRMDALPFVVRSIVLPVVAFIGHATGRYRKYADAPEPMR